MGLYSGPPRDRPEAHHSDYYQGLKTVSFACAGFSLMFLLIGVPELLYPSGEIDSPRAYALLGLGSVMALIALWAYTEMQNEHEVSPLYVEFRNKQLRNAQVGKDVYFLAQDIVDALLEGTEEKNRALARLCRGKGCRTIEKKKFIAIEVVVNYLTDRDDRKSILLMRVMRDLQFQQKRADEH